MKDIGVSGVNQKFHTPRDRTKSYLSELQSKILTLMYKEGITDIDTLADKTKTPKQKIYVEVLRIKKRIANAPKPKKTI